MDEDVRLPPIFFKGLCYDIELPEKFRDGFELIKGSFSDNYVANTLSVTDNVITWGRTNHFLREDFFLRRAQDPFLSDLIKSRLKRIYTASQLSLFLDRVIYLEIGSGTGEFGSIFVERLSSSNRHVFTLWDQNFLISGQDVSENVRKRFVANERVDILKGDELSLRDTFKRRGYNFIHLIDSSLEVLDELLQLFSEFGRPSILMIDWYGWIYYAPQINLINRWCDRNGFSRPVELLTGQGLQLQFT